MGHKDITQVNVNSRLEQSVKSLIQYYKPGKRRPNPRTTSLRLTMIRESSDNLAKFIAVHFGPTNSRAKVITFNGFTFEIDFVAAYCKCSYSKHSTMWEINELGGGVQETKNGNK